MSRRSRYAESSAESSFPSEPSPFSSRAPTTLIDSENERKLSRASVSRKSRTLATDAAASSMRSDGLSPTSAETSVTTGAEGSPSFSTSWRPPRIDVATTVTEYPSWNSTGASSRAWTWTPSRSYRTVFTDPTVVPRAMTGSLGLRPIASGITTSIAKTFLSKRFLPEIAMVNTARPAKTSATSAPTAISTASSPPPLF